MMQKAFGLIETIGLVAAIEAADAALKAANIVLLGYENTKGGGKITIKFTGDVGAVQAAVAAGVAAAQRIGKVYSCLIIPRPHHEIEALIRQVDRPQAAVATPAMSAAPTPGAAPANAPASSPEPPAAAPLKLADVPVAGAQCAAITRSGERCKLPARQGSKYCNFHKKLDG